MIYAILLFLSVILAEVIISKKRGKNVYTFNESASHFLLGVGQQATNLFVLSGLALIYSRIYEVHHFLEFSRENPFHWAIVFLLSDLTYYFVHRASHRVNFFVASHSVHHQARDFNHASALRQSWTTRPFLFLFYVPLAILGVPVGMLIAMQLVNTVIQFFSHNGIITRHLGWVEEVFVTPRSHRVHHGSNAPYLDKNFAGVLIIWDRIFGTYQDLDESIPVRIGPDNDVNYYNPFFANLDYYQKIWVVMKETPGITMRFKILFGSPESLFKRLRHIPEKSLAPLMSTSTPSQQLFLGLTLLAFFLVIPFIAYFGVMPPSLRLLALTAILALLFFAGKQLKLKRTYSHS